VQHPLIALRPFGDLLPRGTEHAEVLDRFLRKHPVAVIAYADRDNPAEFVPLELDDYLGRIRIDRIPNQLRKPLRRTACQSVEVCLGERYSDFGHRYD